VQNLTVGQLGRNLGTFLWDPKLLYRVYKVPVLVLI
jgi:hypothetical protein